ncbi:putative sporulation protein YtxC [Ammoniphilus sp. CFH 90114]|uniref:putative sporulation protein YtxC n=1 Tax=Ammoniphilus sp. CFH 90114 TaxID=2493665 RepID=UPI00100EDA95|nr:putative sporulation protein YtxC [Ammoniphilus sp. CFH 90114]RXT04761.1 hypothetical protein EIZ39_18690 [Ammoniphilus sp. CFH 90114]
MKLIQISVPKSEKSISPFRVLLHSKLKPLQKLLINHQVVELEDQDRLYFRCQFWPVYEHTVDTFDTIREHISLVLAEFIVQYKEKDILREILVQDFSIECEREIEDISNYTFFLLNIDEHGEEVEEGRKDLLKDAIMEKAMDYFMLENQLSLEGFIRFRLKDQWEAWRLVIEHAIDEYWMERENKEFICLLRHFLSTKEKLHPLIHLVHIDDRNLLLYDEHWSEISPTAVEGIPIEMARQQVSYEDVLLHALIALAPQKVILHTEQQNHHIIYMIKRIFDPHAHVCSQCKHCEGWLANGQPSFTNKY